MTRDYILLNSLWVFEVATGHLNFIRATVELNVTHPAIGQRVRALEQWLGYQPFARGSHGLMLTTEGESLLPVFNSSFDRMAGMLDRLTTKHTQEELKVDAVGTLVVGCLFPLLGDSRCSYPYVDLHISIHNNRVDPVTEGLDYTIRHGGRAWYDTDAQHLRSALVFPLCSPALVSQI